MNRKIILIAIAATAVSAVIWLVWNKLCMECFSLSMFNPANIKDFIQEFGPLAIVVFILLYALNTVTLLPPIAVMSLSAGFLFGSVQGFIAIMTGAFLGTTATFFISRYLGGGLVKKIEKNPKAKAFQDKLGKNGFLVILPIRLVGFPPWELVNYASGLSEITYRDYISATMIGIIPATVIQVFFSDRVSSLNFKDPTVYLAIAGFVALLTVPNLIIRWRKEKGKKDVISDIDNSPEEAV